MASQLTTSPATCLEPDKYIEFIDGQYVERPLGTGTHSDCQFNITRLLKALGRQHGMIARQEYTIAHGREWLIPDIAVVTAEFQEDTRGYLLTTPHLCVEILSPGQSESELFRKCRRYHAWGVPHCWVIDPGAQACFEFHGGDTFQLIEPNATLTAGDLKLPASEIFAEER